MKPSRAMLHASGRNAALTDVSLPNVDLFLDRHVTQSRHCATDVGLAGAHGIALATPLMSNKSSGNAIRHKKTSARAYARDERTPCQIREGDGKRPISKRRLIGEVVGAVSYQTKQCAV